MTIQSVLLEATLQPAMHNLFTEDYEWFFRLGLVNPLHAIMGMRGKFSVLL
jgi:hypothetical protein